MWPMHATGALAVVAFATALALGVAGARRAAVAATIAVATLGIAAIAMYGETEARFQSCLGDGRHSCQRSVFGSTRGALIESADPSGSATAGASGDLPASVGRALTDAGELPPSVERALAGG